LNEQQLDRIRSRLHGMLEDLENEVTTTVDGMRTAGGAFPDPTDRATLESERNLTLRIRDRERKLRNKIEDALARIEDGTFGICEVCGDEIGFARLEARPVTTLCINCKSEQEQDEEKRQTG
jgi:DnaK suppressor protein